MPDEGATTVGQIVAFLTLKRDDWTRGVEATERDAQRLARLSPSIRISDNSGEVIAQLAAVRAATRGVGSSADEAKPFVLNLMAALAAVAPAAIPIAGVAGGSLVGLIPVAATVALGIKGITDEFKAGSLQGTRYGQDITTLQTELGSLKQIAAGGLLNGIDRGLAQSKGLFGEVNDDVAVMSGQLGQIIAGAGPALVQILTDLNPLFETLGKFVADGATDLEHWATSSDGVSKFVAYVQAELPDVAKFLGQVVTLFGHLVTAAAPIGGAMLDDLNGLVRVLDAIPIGVFRTAIPLAISLYVALKAYQGVEAIVKGVNRAITAMKTPFVQTASQAKLSQLQVSAAGKRQAADEASSAADIAEAEADKVRAMQNTAREAAAWGAAYTEVTDEVVAAAAEQAAALRGVSDAAVAAAEKEEAAVTAAADTVATEGATASAGWTAMLGPAAAVAVGVGLLATLFLHSGNSAQDAAEKVDAFTQAIKSDSGALGENTRAAVANALQKDGVFKAANQLGISVKTLTDATLGNADATAKVNGALDDYEQKQSKSAAAKANDIAAMNQLLAPYHKVKDAISGTNKDLHDAEQAYKNQAAALGDSALATDNYAQALASISSAKNQTTIDGTTVAFDNQTTAVDALNTALAILSGNAVSSEQAELNLRDTLAGLTDQVKQNAKTYKDNGRSLNENTAEGRKNVEWLLNAITLANQHATAVFKQTNNVDKATGALKSDEAQLRASAIAAGLNKDQVDALIKKYAAVPGDVKTQIIADTTAASKLILGFKQSLDNVARDNPTVHVYADTSAAVLTLSQFINTPATKYVQVQGIGPAGAFGGRQSLDGRGHAAGTGASLPGWFWVGENGPEMMRLPAGTQVKSHPDAVSAAQRAARSGNQARFPSTIVLRVGDREFTGYVDERASLVANQTVVRAGQARALAGAAGTRRVNQ